MTDNQVLTYGPENTMPAVLIEKAISGNADLDKLEKLLELQERWERNEAKKAYIKAMASFKANPPKINKDKRVDFNTSKGRTQYDHASLANVCEKISSALSEHGLSAAWSTNQTDKTISVTCTITHEYGHSESTTLGAAPDTSGSKNPIQAIGSTISYLERYTVLALTGLATHDMDNDGGGSAAGEPVSEDQIDTINRLIEKVNADKARFLRFFGVDSVEKLPESKFKQAKTMLEKKRGE